MCRILLSINPTYVEGILSGTKQYEFRKTKCKKKVDQIVIYSTSPVMKVVGEAEVVDVLENDPEDIWQRTASHSGVTKEFFDAYFCGRQTAIAYKLGKIKRYTEPVDLADFGVRTAPQSFVYL